MTNSFSHHERDKVECFACGRKLGKKPGRVDTRDDQSVFVGRECFKLVMAAGEKGYQPPKGGPRLYPIPGWTPELEAELLAQIATGGSPRWQSLMECVNCPRIVKVAGTLCDPCFKVAEEENRVS